MGLLTPAVKDETNGFRYYSADNMTQIRSIRSLQALGLSLKEVAEYYYDTENMDKLLDKLYELRKMLDRNIQMLQVRSAKQGDFTVHKTVLPRQVCFCREFAETPGLCIYYRGPYEGTGEAMKALMKHISENSIEAAGRLRSVYLEGPPNRGDNSADYITQIAVPIKKFEKV